MNTTQRTVWQSEADEHFGAGRYVVLVELIDYDDDEATQYLFSDRNKARNFILAHVTEVFWEDDAVLTELRNSNHDLDTADEILGRANKGFAIKDWIMR